MASRERTARTAGRSSYEVIYEVVRRIPRGRVCTYGGVARLAGLPRHARLVGYALHALRDESRVPWHRVVNAEGRLSLGRAVPGGDLGQRFRLEREGVRFDASGHIPLGRFTWEPGRSPADAGRRGRRIRAPRRPRPAPP